MTTTTYEGKVDKYFPIWKEPIVLGDYLYLPGSAYFSQPFMFMLNTKTGETNLIEINTADKKNYSIMSSSLDKENNEVNFMIKEGKGKTGINTKLYTFSDGKQTNEILLDLKADDKFPTKAFASKTKDGNYLISGTYSADEKLDNSRSVGVFVVKANSNGKTLFSNYTNYLDINNFTSYLPDNEQEKLNGEKAKTEAKGKEYTKEYDCITHSALTDNGKYVLIGEAYFPNWTTGTDKNGVPYHYIDGYLFTHYFIVEYNDEGKITWSNADELNTKITASPYKHLSVKRMGNILNVVYPSRHYIQNTSYKSNGEELSKEEIKYFGDEETIKRSWEVDAQYWYGNSFISSGAFITKDKKSKNKVFGINKISF